MGPVRIRHSSHHFATGSPVILWIQLGGKPKWLPLKFGYHDVMRTSSIVHLQRLINSYRSTAFATHASVVKTIRVTSGHARVGAKEERQDRLLNECQIQVSRSISTLLSAGEVKTHFLWRWVFDYGSISQATFKTHHLRNTSSTVNVQCHEIVEWAVVRSVRRVDRGANHRWALTLVRSDIAVDIARKLPEEAHSETFIAHFSWHARHSSSWKLWFSKKKKKWENTK